MNVYRLSCKDCDATYVEQNIKNPDIRTSKSHQQKYHQYIIYFKVKLKSKIKKLIILILMH